MSSKTSDVLVVCLLFFLAQQLACAQEQPPAIQTVPQNAALVLEISQPKALLEPLLKVDVAELAETLSGNRSNPKLQEFKGVVA